jgi:hypothetical protein
VGSGERLHVAAWHTKKKITKWEEEGGKTIIHEREQFVHELAIAFADGRTALLEWRMHGSVATAIEEARLFVQLGRLALSNAQHCGKYPGLPG